MHSSVRLMLLNWSGVQVGKKWNKAWLAAPLSFCRSFSVKEIEGLLKTWKLHIKRLNLLFCLPYGTMLGFI